MDITGCWGFYVWKSDIFSLFEWNFAGTSIRLTANNIYRAAVCLFPPSAEECALMCRQGFQDALEFLISNGKFHM